MPYKSQNVRVARRGRAGKAQMHWDDPNDHEEAGFGPGRWIEVQPATEGGGVGLMVGSDNEEAYMENHVSVDLDAEQIDWLISTLQACKSSL